LKLLHQEGGQHPPQCHIIIQKISW